MRIGINATAFNHHPSGIMQRFGGLYTELFRDPTHDYLVFEPRDARLSGYFDAPRVKFLRTALPSDRTTERLLRGAVYWAGALHTHRVDLFDTSLTGGANRRGLTFITIHDLRHVRFPELYSFQRRLVANAITRSRLLRADVVLTVSNAMKADILDVVPRATVRVVPNAVDWSETVDEGRAFDERYILAVGHLEPRKNYIRLIDAFEVVAQRGYAGHLCIIGNPAGDAERIHARVQRSKLRDRIHVKAAVPRRDLKRFYRDADTFVFPSFYEGFGIPVLEAMAFGCPFVLSGLPVFREIAGDAATYFNPADVDHMSDQIWSMLTDSDLRRSCAVLANQARLVYCWKGVAQTYLNVVGEAAA